MWTRLALPQMMVEASWKGAGGGHESRVGAAAWKLVLPDVFCYNTSFAFNFARLHPF